MELKDQLLNLRAANGMTQEEVAKAIGVSRRAIVNYESGARAPKREVLLKLAELFNVELSDLITSEEEFVMDAKEADGSRGKAAAEKLLKNANALFAGGDISEKDKEMLIQALQESYWKSKIKNKKYTPKKYRKDNEENKNEEN